MTPTLKLLIMLRSLARLKKRLAEDNLNRTTTLVHLLLQRCLFHRHNDGIRVQSPTKTVRQNHATYKRLIGVHCIAGISQITRKTTSTTNCAKGIEKLEWFQPIITSKHAKNTFSKKTVFSNRGRRRRRKRQYFKLI